MTRRHAPPPILLTAASLLLLGGCSSDGPTELLDDLTAEEAELMMEALAQAGGVSIPDAGDPGAGPAAVVVSIDVENEVSCPQGGSILVTGSFDGDVDEQTGQGEFSLDYTQAHRSCSVTAPSTGDDWTFDGLPDVGVDFDLLVTQDGFFLDGVQSGTVGWSTDGRSGNCTIDVTYSVSGSETSLSGTVSGSVCGHQISTSVDVSTS